MLEASYDEAFDEHDALRPAYASLQRRLGWDPLRPPRAMAEQLRDRPFDDDTRILPVPLVLDDAEYTSVVQAGARQRALALQRFFADLVGAGSRLVAAGLSEELLETILATEGLTLEALRRQWGKCSQDDIRFVYGPDLVRAPDGRLCVLEDNVGCIGGAADSFFVDDRYRAAAGLRRVRRQDADLAVAVSHCLHRSGFHRQDVVAVLGCDAGGLQELHVAENRRRRSILGAIGVRVASDPAYQPRGVVNFDAGKPADDTVALLNAPGTGVLGNKALLAFSTELIRTYCGEQPILRTLPTTILNGGLDVDPGDLVVKTSTGCGGTEVYFLDSCGPDRRREIDRLVRDIWPPAGAVAQRHVERSRLTPSGPDGWDAYLIELRPVTYVVGWGEVVVSEVPSGRAVSAYDARRLNNTSQGACYLPVLRESIRI